MLIDAKTGAVSKVPAWFDEANGYAKNDAPGELYNLRDDLAQKHNLYAEKPEKVAELKALARQAARARPGAGDRAVTSRNTCSPMKLVTLLIASACLLHTAFAAPPPNIIYIMSDDHAAHAIGAYGGRLAKLNPTPTLDRLAKEGMLFENCFVTNSICTPSRAAILTGQYNHINKVYDLGGNLEPARQILRQREVALAADSSFD